MDLKNIIRSLQKAVGAEADGKAGPETWSALARHVIPDQAAALTDPQAKGIDARSKKNIDTLLPQVRPYAIALIQKAALNGIEIKVISGLRTYAEQDALYAKGRPLNPPKVTNAKGGQSNHNFGIAFDIGVFEGTDYLERSSKYKAVGLLGVDMGLDWGGNWKTFKDEPHFQLRPSWARGMAEKDMLAELRKRKESGEDPFS